MMKIRVLLELARAIPEAAAIAREKMAREKDSSERAAIAKVFNDRYTLCHEYIKDRPQLEGSAMGGLLPRGGFAWMCPECNHIHHPDSCSVFTGLQYPACCSTAAGHRIQHGIKTP